jgi:hypothetical protein
VRCHVQHRRPRAFQRQEIGNIDAGVADHDGEMHRAMRPQHEAHGAGQRRAGGEGVRGGGGAAGAAEEALREARRGGACDVGEQTGELGGLQDRSAAARELAIVGAEGGDGVGAFGGAAEQAAVQRFHLAVGHHVAAASRVGMRALAAAIVSGEIAVRRGNSARMRTAP